MAEEKKLTDEQEQTKEKSAEQSESAADGESKSEEKPEDTKDKPNESTEDEQKPDEGKSDDKSEEKPPDDKSGEGSGESASDSGEDSADDTPAPPEMTREQQLEEENFRLKTQMEAMKLGFNPDCIEDAVTLAECAAKRDGTDIAKALEAVAKKYPDWKSDSGKGSKGGFKVGADSSGGKTDSGKSGKQTAEKRWNRFN